MPEDVKAQAHYGKDGSGRDADIKGWLESTMGVQPTEYAAANFTYEELRGVFKHAIFKYVHRYQDKRGIRDLNAAQVYLGWLIELEESRD